MKPICGAGLLLSAVVDTPGGARGYRPAANAARPLTGTVLDGRYRVGGMIARGGMSTVYRGSDLRLDRPVAIKVMAPSFAADPSFLTRFEREARSAAGLAHRGIVGVFDQGRDGDIVFLVMELVDGGTLRDLIHQSGALSVSVTMSILEPLLAALGAAHDAGLVHRDVKPENVLISSKGEVKVADFGLVRAVTSQSMATGDVILGTVAYLSPEQVSTGAADPRSDVYSAGIVAYEMLTGHPPYTGDNAISVAYQHVHFDVPAVTDRAPGVPLELDDLILAATRRDPMARPRDASAFLSALVALRARLRLARVAVPVPRSGAQRVTGPTSGRPAGPAATAVEPGSTRRVPAGTRMVPAATSGVSAATRAVPTQTAVARPHPPAARPDLRAYSGAMRRQPRKVRRAVIVTLIVVLLGAAAAAGGWWLGSGRWSYTPGAVGVPRASAEVLVRSAGLVPHISTEPSDTVAQGTVADSRPEPGARVLRGSAVDLVVSEGRPVVPAVAAGGTSGEAEQAIRAAHLTPVVDPTRDRFAAGVAPGAVVGTDPAADTALPIAAPVLVILSKGAPPLPVPEVAGKSVDDAQNKLLVAGFRLGPVQRQFSTAADDGSVLGTRPGEGQLVAAGSAVSLVLALSITVPLVRGETGSQAESDLVRSGLIVSYGASVFDQDVDGGSAVGTDPAPGTMVDPAYPAVILTLSNAVAVPDVTQGDLGTARQQLAAAGLDIEISSLFGASGASVTGQVPSAGSRVQPGSTVIVSAFP